jgi:integrase
MPKPTKIAWKNASGENSTRWQVRYKDASGRRRARQFERKKEAQDFADTITASVRAGTHVPERETATVAKAAEIWIEACARGRDGREPVEASTLRMYRQHVRLHIVPILGGLKLSNLMTQRVRSFRDDDLLGGGRSRAMTKKILGSLSSICGEAAARGQIAVNPCAGVTIVNSGRHKHEVQIPSKDEVRRLLARSESWVTEPPRAIARRGGARVTVQKRISRHRALWFHTMLVFIISTGCRLSEVRGASKRALDLRLQTYHVDQRADERGRIGAPKSAAGYRTLDLAPRLVALLDRWLKVSPAGDFIFPNNEARVESMQAIYRRYWLPLLVEEGLAKRIEHPDGRIEHETQFSVHDLRHFYASLQIEGGMQAKELQAVMGHASIKITMDVYGHLFHDDQAKARRREMIVGAVEGLMGDTA